MIAVVVLPLIALIGFGVLQVKNSLDSLSNNDRVHAQIGLYPPLNQLITALQSERAASRLYIDSSHTVGGATMIADRTATDATLTSTEAAMSRLHVSAADQPVRTAMTSLRTALAGLPAQRAQIGAKRAGDLAAVDYYTNTIAAHLLLMSKLAARGNPNPLLVGQQELLTSITESIALQPVLLSPVLLNGRFTPAEYQAYVSNSSAATYSSQTLFSIMNAKDAALFTSMSTGADATVARTLGNRILAAGAAGQPITFSRQVVNDDLNKLVLELRSTQGRFADETNAKSASVASAAHRRVTVTVALVLLVLLLSVGLSFMIARTIQRQLQRLRAEALKIAEVHLPSVVQRLHDGEPLDPADETQSLSVTSDDEIGQVAVAFNTVLDTAVRSTIEQASMRKSTGDTFLNLARRSQSLIHRQLKVIDRLERKESDPDNLEELFRLDHLATRMRRHAEDLIVLSGAAPARGWRKPVTLSDVVRGAVAEVEDYTRVTVLPISDGAIAGHAVGDVIHLLAELIENATSFSPPHTPVHVSGHEVANGCVIEVDDRGLGMPAVDRDKLNARLADPPRFDLATSERLGLFVVGQLAHRHGVRVMLRPSPYGGTTAIVLLPQSLIRSDDETRGGDPEANGRRPTPRPAGAEADRAIVDEATDDLPSSDLAPAPRRTRRRREEAPRHAAESGDGLAASAADPGPSDDHWDLGDTPPAPDHAFDAFDTLASRMEPSFDAAAPAAEPAYGLMDLTDDPELPEFRELADRLDLPGGGEPEGRDRSAYGAGEAFPETPASQPVSNWFVKEADSGLLATENTPDDYRPPGIGGRRAAPGLPDPARSAASLPGPRQWGDAAGTRSAALPSDSDASGQSLSGITPLGLPKRTRRASLAPGLRGLDEDGDAQSAPAAPRSAADARSLMSSFQSGFGRGLRDAIATEDISTEDSWGR